MAARCAVLTEPSRLKTSVVCHGVAVAPRAGKSEIENLLLPEPGWMERRTDSGNVFWIAAAKAWTKNVSIWNDKTGVSGGVYSAASNHLLRRSLLVCLVGVCQIISQDTGVAVIGRTCIFISGQVLGDAIGRNPGLEIIAEYRSLLQVNLLCEGFGFDPSVLQGVKAGEFEIGEAFFLGNLSNSLPIRPDIAIRDTQNI